MRTRFPCPGTVIASLEFEWCNDATPSEFLIRIKSGDHVRLALVVSTVYETSTMAGSKAIGLLRWGENILEAIEKMIRNI